jgi:acid phosphatase (class A)
MTCRALHRLAAALLLALPAVPGAAQTAAPPTDPAAIGTIRPGSPHLRGYLERNQLPDSLALLPPPPAAGSAAEAADLEAHRRAQAHKGKMRWDMGRQEADLKFPQAASAFSCALDLPITQEQTPHLYTLLRRTMADAGLASYKAKENYQRPRPFVVLKEEMCAPSEAAHLSKDGAYPSGHAAFGWAWALVLAGLAPERADALLQRGRAFGENRMICGVHWQSDVDAGFLVGAAAVGRLQASPVFKAQAELARAEVQAARQQGLKSPRSDCKQEAQALAP